MTMATGPGWSARKVDRLRQLRAFCQAAEMKSITLGAKAIGLSQPTVSAHIRELEFEMEATLLERHGPRIALTEAGERLYEIARPIVERMERMPVDLAERIDKSVSGEIRMGAGAAAISFALPRFVKRFRDDYPNIRLRIERILADDSHALLEDGGVEFLIGLPRPADDRFFYHPIFSWEVVLIVPEDHPLAGRESVDIRDISGYPIIVPPDGTYSNALGESIKQLYGTEVQVAVETNGWGIIKRYVTAGLGISVIPSVCLSEGDRLSVIPFGQYSKPWSYGVTIRRDAPLSSSARRFLAMLDPEFPFPR